MKPENRSKAADPNATKTTQVTILKKKLKRLFETQDKAKTNGAFYNVDSSHLNGKSRQATGLQQRQEPQHAQKEKEDIRNSVSKNVKHLPKYKQQKDSQQNKVNKKQNGSTVSKSKYKQQKDSQQNKVNKKQNGSKVSKKPTRNSPPKNQKKVKNQNSSANVVNGFSKKKSLKNTKTNLVVAKKAEKRLAPCSKVNIPKKRPKKELPQELFSFRNFSGEDYDSLSDASYIYEDEEEEEEEYFGEEGDSEFETTDTDYEKEVDDYLYSSDGEEEESYNSDDSDFESTDYEDDEDEESYTENSYDFESASNDEDYTLPEDVPEDLIIHRGTATKHPLQQEHGVDFDSDADEAQIVELSTEHIAKCVEQPQGFSKEELLRLTLQKFSLKSKETSDEAPVQQMKVSESSDNSEECPQLVPIVDEDGFQLYNPDKDYSEDLKQQESLGDDSLGDDSLGSDYEECSSDASFVSLDINSKYMAQDSDTDEDSEDDELRLKTNKMQADIIYADKCNGCGVETPFKKSLESGSSIDQNSEKMPMEKVVHPESVCQGEVITTQLPEYPSYTTDSINSNSVKNCSEEATPPITLNELHSIPTPLAASPTECEVSGEKFESIFCNAVNANMVLVLLKEPLYIYGTLRLTPLVGRIEIYGHNPIIGSELEVFSPRGCSMVQISPKPLEQISSSNRLKSTLKPLKAYFQRADISRLLREYIPQEHAVLLLKRNLERKKCIGHFRKYMNENVFPNMNSLQSRKDPLYGSEAQLRCLLQITVPAMKSLHCPPQWYGLPFSPNTRLMLTGGKAVGKSTLLRFLLNRHLAQHKRILVIDLDIGQPELFVPQTISCFVVTQPLLGPGFFLNLQPARAYMVGHTNIVLCAHTYLRAVRALLQYCHANEEFAQLPWLVNTMGYNKGFGLELIGAISELLRPTDVVQLQSNKPINNFDILLAPQDLAAVPRVIYSSTKFLPLAPTAPWQYRLHVLNTAVPQESRFQRGWEMSAKDLRYASMLARLSDALQGNAEWLTDCKPLSASLDQLKIIHTHSNEFTQDQLLQAVTATLVYLCHHTNTESPLECFGIGIVRAIDYNIQQLYLLPAMACSLLTNVNCLAMGEMPLPTSMLINQGPKIKEVVPYVYNTVNTEATKAIKQIFHRPSEFLTGRHNHPLEP